MKNKKCTQCQEWKSLDDFRKASKEKDGHQYACRDCANKGQKLWRSKNKDIEREKGRARRAADPDKHNKRSRRWRDANPDKVKANHILKRYGITLAQWNSMFDQQSGCCKICDIHQDKLEKELAVDHDHLTGRVRGLLCCRCNRAVGLLGDSVALLQRAVDYLKDF